MGKEVVFVIGHKNPDTDSVCAAIGLAELKKSLGMDNVFPARAGDLNPQTSFVLDYFKAAAPRYLPDVYPRARDIMSLDVVRASVETPIIKVMEMMRDTDIGFVPVLDAAGKPAGVLTLMDLAKSYMERIEVESASIVTTTLKNITETLGGSAVLDFLGGKLSPLRVSVGAMAKESFEKILSGKNPGECAVIVGDRSDIQTASVEKGVALMIVTGGFAVGDDIIGEARKKKVSIVVSPYDSATTALLVRLSIPAGSVCNPAFEKAAPDDLVEEIRWRAAGTDGLVVLDNDGIMRGVITKTDLLKPSNISLVLVDHNELPQAVDGAERVSIIEVVDHHRIGGFHTSQPIPFVCEPVGSTSTLVSEFYVKLGVPIGKETAGLLLAGVLSDTVILKSPTATGRDRAAVKWLEERSGLDGKRFGAEIFAAASSLKKRGPKDSVNADFKVFEAKGKKFGVGQVETIGFEEFFEEKEGLKVELLAAMEKKGLTLSALLVTDIVMGTSLLLAVGESKILWRLDYPKLGDCVYELKNVISRKKQVVPHLLGIFSEIY